MKKVVELRAGSHENSLQQQRHMCQPTTLHARSINDIIKSQNCLSLRTFHKIVNIVVILRFKLSKVIFKGKQFNRKFVHGIHFEFKQSSIV